MCLSGSCGYLGCSSVSVTTPDVCVSVTTPGVCVSVRQLRVPRLQQCAGVQVRLLSGSAAGGLELVNRSTPDALLFGAESCGGQLKVGPLL